MNAPTEFPFTLPRGYVDRGGKLHREGSMRLATAFDEIGPMKEAKVQANPGYLGVILLSRVITSLGDLPAVSPGVIEELPIADFAYLQSLYQRINENGHSRLAVACPQCEHHFEVEVVDSGEH